MSREQRFEGLDQPAHHRRRGRRARSTAPSACSNGWRPRGEKLDACIVGEPTSAAQLGDMVKIGRRGSLTWLAERRSAPRATPPIRISPTMPIPRLMTMLRAHARSTPLDRGNEHFRAVRPCRSPPIDIGNPATNVIPGEARAAFNIRFNDGMDSGKSWKPGCGKSSMPWAARYDARDPGERRELLDAAGRDQRASRPGDRPGDRARRPSFSTTGGTSDARFIHAYCPVAEFGLVGLHHAQGRRARGAGRSRHA